MADENWTDPIVEEVRRVRDEHAAKFRYDLGALCDNLRKEQNASKRKVVSFPPRRPTSDPPTEGAA